MNKKDRRGPKSRSDFKYSSAFYEELTVLKAQEVIAGLMNSSKTTKAELAERLGQTKAHITNLLAEDRNLTMRTFGRVCFHLGAEVDVAVKPIAGTQWDVKVYSNWMGVPTAPAQDEMIADSGSALLGAYVSNGELLMGVSSNEFADSWC